MATCFFHKDDHAYVNQVSYADLYPLVANEAVDTITNEGNHTLSLHLKNPSSKLLNWVQVVDGKQTNYSAHNPQFFLQPGLNEYEVTSSAVPDTFSARIEYLPATGGGDSIIAITKLNAAKVSIKNIVGSRAVDAKVSDTEDQQLNKLLTDSMGLKASMTTNEKVEHICLFLHDRIYTSAGIPSEQMLQRSVLEQYKTACKGEKIWCGIYASIFNLFATRAGIICRDVELKINYGSILGNRSCDE